MDRLFAVDVGNTNITFGVFEDEHLRATARISTDPTRTADELSLTIDGLLRARPGLPVQPESMTGTPAAPAGDEAAE